jgi:ElaB/YqjD/DUF883 family membrane-anchored ribosome-binding protein
MSNINLSSNVNSSDVAKAQLIDDFKVVIADAEALIKATANQGGDAVATVRIRAEKSLAQAKTKVVAVEGMLRARAKAASKVTDDYARENPWQTLGIAAGLGLLIGLVIGNR